MFVWRDLRSTVYIDSGGCCFLDTFSTLSFDCLRQFDEPGKFGDRIILLTVAAELSHALNDRSVNLQRRWLVWRRTPHEKNISCACASDLIQGQL